MSTSGRMLTDRGCLPDLGLDACEEPSEDRGSSDDDEKALLTKRRPSAACDVC